MKPRIHAMFILIILGWFLSPDSALPADAPSCADRVTCCRSSHVGHGTSCPADSETTPKCNACVWCVSCCFITPAEIGPALISSGQGVLLALSDEVLLDGIHPSIWRPPTMVSVG